MSLILEVLSYHIQFYTTLDLPVLRNHQLYSTITPYIVNTIILVI